LENINNLKIKSLAFTNDKTAVSFTENVALSAANWKSISRKMMFAVNAYNQYLGSKESETEKFFRNSKRFLRCRSNYNCFT
jgi:hypothetical protein